MRSTRTVASTDETIVATSSSLPPKTTLSIVNLNIDYDSSSQSNDGHSKWSLFLNSARIYGTVLLLLAAAYSSLVLLLSDDALPGSPLFPVLLIWFTASVFAQVAILCKLPSLIGMLLAGVMLANIPGALDGAKTSWYDAIRATGLAIILMRSGLELDLAAFARVGWATVRLTFLPGISEACIVGISSKYILDLPWAYGFTLGFIIAAVSPAVVITGMFDLQKRGFGVAKGIPAMIVAAASFDDVVAITGYSIASGLAYSTGSVIYNAFHGPLNVVIGVLGGVAAGVILWPTRIWDNFYKRITAFILMGLIATFAGRLVHFTGAAAMWCMVMGIVANMGWVKGVGVPSFAIGATKAHSSQIEHALGIYWKLVQQPLLFGSIGAALNFSVIPTETIPKALGIIAIGLTIRLPVAFLSVLGVGLNVKEKVFVALAWIGKATVQAALGSAALDYALSQDPLDQNKVRYGLDILTVSVFAILLTAPTGVVIIQIFGPRWLEKSENIDPQTKELLKTFGNDTKESISPHEDLSPSTPSTSHLSHTEPPPVHDLEVVPTLDSEKSDFHSNPAPHPKPSAEIELIMELAYREETLRRSLDHFLEQGSLEFDRKARMLWARATEDQQKDPKSD